MTKLKTIIEFIKYLYSGSNLTYCVLCEANIGTPKEYLKSEFDTKVKAENHVHKLITEGKLYIYTYVELSRVIKVRKTTK